MKDFVYLLPEIFIALTLGFVLIGEISYHGERIRLISATAIMGLAAAFLQTILTYRLGAAQIFGRSVSIDGFSLFFKLFFITLAAVSIMISRYSKEVEERRKTEYCALILASALGACLAASAADLLLGFVALQCTNVLAAFLAGYRKRSLLSTEAAVKLMLTSAFSAALLLYGFALLFGASHALNIYDIHQAFAKAPLGHLQGLVIFGLIFLALAAQIAAFPLYQWAPDTLEGAPTPASAFISVGTRAAGFAVALRFLIVIFALPGVTQGQWQVPPGFDWTRVLALSAGFSMVIGALLSFRQTGAKRLVGSLVVSQTGFLLLGLLVLDEVGVAALLYNLVVELFALTGAFYILSLFYDYLDSDRLEDLKGMLGKAVPESICLILFLLAIVGLPPMPGFIGKFTLIGVAIRHGELVLAAIAVGSMALMAVAVARLAFCLVGDFRKIHTSIPAELSGRRAYLIFLVAPMAAIGIFAQFFLGFAARSLGFIFW